MLSRTTLCNQYRQKTELNTCKSSSSGSDAQSKTVLVSGPLRNRGGGRVEGNVFCQFDHQKRVQQSCSGRGVKNQEQRRPTIYKYGREKSPAICQSRTQAVGLRLDTTRQGTLWPAMDSLVTK